MALGSTQPLTEMTTRIISWGGKDDWCVELTISPPSYTCFLEIWEPQTPGTSGTVQSKAWVYVRSLAGIAGSNPGGAWVSVVSIVCCTGRGLCVGLITRPEECGRCV